MGFFRDIRAGLRLVFSASRVVSSLGALWLWLYVLVTSFSAALSLPLGLFASSEISNDPYLWSGRLLPWVEVFWLGVPEYGWLGLGAIVALVLSWGLGIWVFGGVAGATAWRRDAFLYGEPLGDGKHTRGAFGSAGLRFFGTALLLQLFTWLSVALVLVVVFLFFRYGSFVSGLTVVFVAALWLGGFFFWRALVMAARIRGLSVWGALATASSELRKHPGRMIGAMMPLSFNYALLLVGLFLLLRFGLYQSFWLFLLQQAWVLARLGQKLLLQATADVWARPDPAQGLS